MEAYWIEIAVSCFVWGFLFGLNFGRIAYAAGINLPQEDGEK